jgi:hypothetical protein
MNQKPGCVSPLEKAQDVGAQASPFSSLQESFSIFPNHRPQTPWIWITPVLTRNSADDRREKVKVDGEMSKCAERKKTSPCNLNVRAVDLAAIAELPQI